MCYDVYVLTLLSQYHSQCHSLASETLTETFEKLFLWCAFIDLLVTFYVFVVTKQAIACTENKELCMFILLLLPKLYPVAH